jgi:hypothetical protein
LHASAFQNVRRSPERFAAIVIGPYAPLTTTDLASLDKSVERRQVLGHDPGLAAARYGASVGAEEPGHTVRLRADELLRVARLAAEVIGALEMLPEFLPRRRPWVNLESSA